MLYAYDKWFCNHLGRIVEYTVLRFGWDQFALARTSIIVGAIITWCFIASDYVHGGVTVGIISDYSLKMFALALLCSIFVPVLLLAYLYFFLNRYMRFVQKHTAMQESTGDKQLQAMLRIGFWILAVVFALLQHAVLALLFLTLTFAFSLIGVEVKYTMCA